MIEWECNDDYKFREKRDKVRSKNLKKQRRANRIKKNLAQKKKGGQSVLKILEQMKNDK